MLQAVHQQAAVRDAGQLIMGGQELDPPLGAFDGRDIADWSF
jgi:hypothetical protein